MSGKPGTITINGVQVQDQKGRFILRDVTMCAPSECPRRDTCKRTLPDGPVDPQQSVADHFKQWGTVCPFYMHKPKAEA